MSIFQKVAARWIRARYEGPNRCEKCRGTGFGPGLADCDKCGGSGKTGESTDEPRGSGLRIRYVTSHLDFVFANDPPDKIKQTNLWTVDGTLGGEPIEGTIETYQDGNGTFQGWNLPEGLDVVPKSLWVERDDDTTLAQDLLDKIRDKARARGLIMSP